MIASACISGSAFGQTDRNAAPKYSPASYYSYYDEASPSTGKLASAPSTKVNSEVVQASATNCDNTKACDNTAACDSGKACDSAGGLGSGLGGALGGRLGRGCDNSGGGAAGCDIGSGAAGGCDSMCGSSGLFGMGILGTGRALNDPWKLFSNPIAGFNVGGWTSVGYHSYANPFSFNTYPKRLQLGQQWFYAEKVADGSNGVGLGGRVDYLYGTDAPDTQSFGIANNHWDNGWDNGAQYGHALPQAYVEAAYGDMSVKVGHFFTIVGNEVV
ncbi:MAG: outer membrane beta-barrel protein, partial [Pirellula sp.]